MASNDPIRSERHEFTMSKNLLRHVIFRQAGTLQKAVLEGVMNSVDARATEIEITADETQVRIRDNGHGLRTRDEILKVFKEFGAEHLESENKIYGAFRMGRGQMFAFGVNTWRTRRFGLHVDMEQPGAAFDLVEHDEDLPGCDVTIDLFERHRLLPSGIIQLERAVKDLVAYMSIPVTFNGTRVSTDPADEKWDKETDEAYFRFKNTGSLVRYNLGAFVDRLSSSRYGTGGVIVSKHAMKVNMARNDVQADCPIWTEIHKVVKKHAGKTTKKKVRLNDNEREYIATQIAAGDFDGDASNVKVITDVTGRHWNGSSVMSHLSRHSVPKITVAEEGDFRGDTLMQRNLAFVISTETLERFSVRDLDALIALFLERKVWHYPPRHAEADDFENVAAGMSSDHRIIDRDDWTAKEAFLMDFVKSVYRYITPWGEKPRKLLLGESETARAWTDGDTYVAIRRDLLHATENVEGFTAFAEILAHELAHSDATTERHNHTPEFYRTFHDLVVQSRFVQKFVKKATSHFPTALERHGRSWTKKQLRTRDKLARAEAKRDEVYAQLDELDVLQDAIAQAKEDTKTARKARNAARKNKDVPTDDLPDSYKEGRVAALESDVSQLSLLAKE